MRLHHEVDGAGPPLLLSGSLGSSLAMWEPQLPALVARFRVIRHDHPGHGGSPVPDAPIAIDDLGRAALALLDEFGIERASVCGLSLGGVLAQWLGANAPDRVERLVLACTSPRFGSRESWLQRAETVRREGLGAIADPLLERWFTPAFPEAAKEPMRAMLLATPPEGYARCCELLADCDLRGDLRRISAPTLVLTGADDPSVPPGHDELLADRIVHARLIPIAGAAHLANVEQADAFTAALLEHLGA